MNCEPDPLTYVAALKACGGLASDTDYGKQFCLNKGTIIHNHAKQRGFDSDLLVASSLVDFYSKCNDMKSAKEVFDRMVFKDVVCWTSLILGYVQNGESLAAMDLFARMSCKPDCFTYAAVLKACGSLASERESDKPGCLEKGISIHKQVSNRGFESDLIVASALVDMYSKCGSMNRARQVFDSMIFKNVVTWTGLVQGYVQNGHSSEAMELFCRMDCEPDYVTCMAALKACGSLASDQNSDSDRSRYLEKGIGIHKLVKQRGFDSDAGVANMLVDMYSKCGRMDCAREVFDSIIQEKKNVALWTSLIQGYELNRESSVAVDLFTNSMDCEPDPLAYIAVLKACRSLASQEESEKNFWLERGIALHEQLKQRKFESDITVASTLIHLYSKCGSMDRAKEVFESMVAKDAVVWNSLILGYIHNGESSVGLDLFSSMDCEADLISYTAALKACGSLAAEKESNKQAFLEKGIGIHTLLKDRGLSLDMVVANTLVEMYSRCGSMDRARQVFEEMGSKNVVSWTNLILGFVQNGESSTAMEVFSSMDCEANCFTYVGALRACGDLAALQSGQQIHAEICKLGLEQDRVAASALLDFYGKCGSMSRAEELFSNMQSPDAVSWNSLIAGYGFFGDSARAFNLARKMQEAGLRMNGITFLSILTACSHAGMIEEGKKCFESMPAYGLSPSVEHYTCVIDMLGRSNRLQEAAELVKNMPVEANAVTWRALLGSCRKWGNLDVGKVAFDALVAGKTRNAAAYVLMSDMWKKQEILKNTSEA